MQDCRLMTEPCQCPRCRCEMRLPCQEKCLSSVKCCNMGGLPLETQASYDSRGRQAECCQRSCWQNRSDPLEVFQNFTPGNPQKLPQESARNWNCQPPLNCFYGQQSSRQVTQEPRQQFPQDSCQQFSQDSYQQFPQKPSQQFAQRSQRKCCFQLPPQNCCQQPRNMFQENFEGQNITRRRSCYCVTHEMGVQTDECKCKRDQREDYKCKKDQTETACPTDEEEGCRCKRDETETPCPCREESQDSMELDYIAVTELTTKEMEVKHRTGTKDIFIEKVQSVTHFPTDPNQAITKIHTVEKTQKKKPEEITENDIVPLRPLRKSELEPIVESMKAEVSKSGSNSETGELIYHKYETYERDFGDSKKTVEKSINKVKTPVGSPPSRISRSPNNRSPTRGSPTKPLSRSPTDNISRSESGKDTGASNSDQNTSIVNDEDISSDNSNDKEEEMPMEKERTPSDSDNEKVPNERKRIPSDYDNVSTVHMRVTNRKEASVKRPNAKESNGNMTAVYESRVSQVMVRERAKKKPDEKKPSEKKPRQKRPKILPPPKMEMKQGYPSNDLICRFANPPKCRPTCRTFRFPCPPSNSFNSCKSYNQCPSRIPSTRQYDPIYGFGSKCIAYYCR
ncbi:muscle M-line assembly protein unc-89 isoform X2 [Drosophila takahashii]|uniref:muscle M-line assembly protein unc-89 isoform X2 n=1 Tax=Drosophila takahashii TaxID=29030 RepID=UPI003899088B